MKQRCDTMRCISIRSFWLSTLVCCSLGPGIGLSGEVTFTDVTAAAGIEYVQYQIPDPPPGPAQKHVYMTGGAAAGDFDADGFVDLFVTRLDAPDILYRNKGDGSFEDVSHLAGFTESYASNGAAWADVDNDGDQDLYVTSLFGNRYHMYMNDGKGRFTEEALLRGAAILTDVAHYGFSPSFGDYDRDGFVDLYVAEWGQRESPSHSRLLRNRGKLTPGSFEDVTESAGVSIDHLGVWVSAFAPRFADLDGDGWDDLVFANDFGTSRLFWNNRDGTFSDGTVAAGVGTDENGMGSAIADFDGDGRLDWFVTAVFDARENRSGWGGSGNRLYRNEGGRVFSDQTSAAGVRDGAWGWGAAFLDYDNDADVDLVMTNGINLAYAHGVDAAFHDDSMRLWRNDGGVFTEMGRQLGISDTGSGKGLLTFDYDQDGDLDIFVVNNAGRPVLYRNDAGTENDWIRVSLVGTLSNRDALGARLTLIPSEADLDSAMVAHVDAGSHYLGQSERTVHFGLGISTPALARLTVEWPSGVTTIHKNIPRNKTITIVEPVPEPSSLMLWLAAILFAPHLRRQR